MIYRSYKETTYSAITDDGRMRVCVGEYVETYWLEPSDKIVTSFYVQPWTGTPRFWRDPRPSYAYGELMWTLLEHERRIGHQITVDLSCLMPPMIGESI